MSAPWNKSRIHLSLIQRNALLGSGVAAAGGAVALVAYLARHRDRATNAEVMILPWDIALTPLDDARRQIFAEIMKFHLRDYSVQDVSIKLVAVSTGPVEGHSDDDKYELRIVLAKGAVFSPELDIEFHAAVRNALATCLQAEIFVDSDHPGPGAA